MASPDPHRELAQEEVAQCLDALRLLSDQLELFLDGQDDAWTADHALQVHAVGVRANAAVEVVRALREAEARRATYIRLVDGAAAPVIPLGHR